MGKGLRYNIQHLGDHFVGALGKGFGAIQCSTKGISLTYDIHDLETRRRKVCRLIGERIAEIRPASPENDLFRDERLREIFSRLDNIDAKIEASRREREDRLNPCCSTVETGETG
jgi:hypothetical protein